MAKQSKKQKDIIGRVMHEWKHGELKSSSGQKVKNPKQAIAIGLSESGSSDRQTPNENARNLKRTVRREREGATGKPQARSSPAKGPTRDELYAEAKKRGIDGRARMSKDELAKALGR